MYNRKLAKDYAAHPQHQSIHQLTAASNGCTSCSPYQAFKLASSSGPRLAAQAPLLLPDLELLAALEAQVPAAAAAAPPPPRTAQCQYRVSDMQRPPDRCTKQLNS